MKYNRAKIGSMRTFILKALLLCVITVTLIVSYCYFTQTIADDVQYVISMADKDNLYSSVIIGDSVGRQIFNRNYQNESSRICYLASNQAITMAGQYLLLLKYLENNPNTDKIVFVGIPEPLSNSFNMNYTYQYFVAPFINNNSIKLLDANTVNTLYAKFGRLAIENQIIRSIILKIPFVMEKYLYYRDSMQEYSTINGHSQYNGSISPETIQYIKKILQLCESRDISFTMISPPISKSTYALLNIDKALDIIWSDGLENVLQPYYNDLLVIDDSCFQDNVHFGWDYLGEHRDEIRDRILQVAGLNIQ